MRYYWIKERHNPQLGTYYLPYGQMYASKAKALEKSIYGTNRMIKFETYDEYKERCEELGIFPLRG